MTKRRTRREGPTYWAILLILLILAITAHLPLLAHPDVRAILWGG